MSFFCASLVRQTSFDEQVRIFFAPPLREEPFHVEVSLFFGSTCSSKVVSWKSGASNNRKSWGNSQNKENTLLFDDLLYQMRVRSLKNAGKSRS